MFPFKSRRSWKFSAFLVLLLFGIAADSQGQCAMCRAALESEESGVQAAAVNDGIVYLMIIPYVIIAALGFAIYKLKYGKKKEAKNQ